MLSKLQNKVSLGLGLIGIGRPWGHVVSEVPKAELMQTFLQAAYDLGVEYFDTAAAYGTSEERLGVLLKKLTSKQRGKIVVATKFGDHWDSNLQNAFVDHTFDALKQSLDTSLKHLQTIDLLYLHKATITALTSPDVEKAFEYAKTKGIKNFGASISDIEAGRFVCNSKFFSVIQLPLNQQNKQFLEIIELAKKKRKIVVINRPFNMGSMLYASEKPHDLQDKVKAYKFILENDFHGVVLTGTKSYEHLKENLQAFTIAKKELGL